MQQRLNAVQVEALETSADLDEWQVRLLQLANQAQAIEVLLLVARVGTRARRRQQALLHVVADGAHGDARAHAEVGQVHLTDHTSIVTS